MKIITKLADIDKETAYRTAKQLIEEHEQNFTKRIIEMLNHAAGMKEFSGISKLEHGLQTATLAYRANASDTMIFASLCHDVAKYVGQVGHGEMAAEMMRPFIPEDEYKIIYTHEEFQGFYYYDIFGLDKNSRDKYRNEPWFDKALVFNEWDNLAFDPKFKSKPLEEFVPLIVKLCSKYPRALSVGVAA